MFCALNILRCYQRVKMIVKSYGGGAFFQFHFLKKNHLRFWWLSCCFSSLWHIVVHAQYASLSGHLPASALSTSRKGNPNCQQLPAGQTDKVGLFQITHPCLAGAYLSNVLPLGLWCLFRSFVVWGCASVCFAVSLQKRQTAKKRLAASKQRRSTSLLSEKSTVFKSGRADGNEVGFLLSLQNDNEQQHLQPSFSTQKTE